MNFKLYTRVLDGGEAVVRVIIDCGHEMNAARLSNDLFNVQVKRYYQGKLLDEANRVITNVYTTTTENGYPSHKGRYIHLSLLTHKDTKAATTMIYDTDLMLTRFVDLAYDIRLNHDLICEDGVILHARTPISYAGLIAHHVDRFEDFESSLGLKYREFAPEFDGNKKPLVVWLHGMGESGHDNRLQISANRGGVAFVTKESQEIFGGCYVIAPQCPSFWMPIEYHEKKINDDYTKQILSLIDEVCVFHPDIDEDRIYIGGCSMGGYQTFKTVLANPNRFAAAFPICAAYQLSTKEAWRLKNLPIWLVHSLADATVSSELSIKNYELLKQVNTDVELTLYPEVRYNGELYNGHASWVLALRNLPVNEEGVHLFEWLSRKSQQMTLQTKELKKKKRLYGLACCTLALCLGAIAIQTLNKKEN